MVSVSENLVSEKVSVLENLVSEKGLGFEKFGLRKQVWVSEKLVWAESFGFIFGSFGIQKKKKQSGKTMTKTKAKKKRLLFVVDNDIDPELENFNH